MKLGVRLARLNETGITVGIENSEMDSFDLVSTMSHQNPKRAIDAAIVKLGKLISKLHELKQHDSPFKAVTQEKINGFK